MILVGYKYLIRGRYSYALPGSVKGKKLNMSVRYESIDKQAVSVSIDTTPVECSLSDLGEIRLEMVSGSPLESLWNTLVREYHYLSH
ncbi:hypothetical protein LCGC14_3094420, partial [marine sediment metagenome]